MSDNGKQLKLEEFERLYTENGIFHIRSTPYHPEENGLVERFHGMHLFMLCKYCKHQSGKWSSLLPVLLYYSKATPSASPSCFPYTYVLSDLQSSILS